MILLNNPCQYVDICRNAKPYCFDTDTFQSNCISRGWFECNKSNWYCPKCLNRDEPEICLDCDPVDPPCSLFENSERW